MKKPLCWVHLAALAFLPQQAFGCTIPVFRYALEKWELTPYEVLVYHRGPLPADVEKVLKAWDDAPKNANCEITRIDLNGKMTKSQENVWQREGNPRQTPWLVIRYLAADSTEPSAWRGPCTAANLSNIIDSPMRRAILAHLTRGASTVFVILTSDDAAADRAALDLTVRELKSLEKKIKLPVQSDSGPQIKLPIPLKVSFPVLVLDRNQPEEAAFVRMLLATEERLLKIKGPVLFPIFGRGRVLGGLTDKEIAAEQIMEVAKFLCRECSCQVKELNPGIDMLMRTNWTEAFDALYDGKEPLEMPVMAPAYLTPSTAAVTAKETPQMTNKTSSAPSVDGNPSKEAKSEPSSQRHESPSMHAAPEERDSRRFDLRFALWIGIGVASGLVLLSGGWVVYQARK